jgi:hypothetical protein
VASLLSSAVGAASGSGKLNTEHPIFATSVTTSAERKTARTRARACAETTDPGDAGPASSLSAEIAIDAVDSFCFIFIQDRLGFTPRP